MVLLSTEYLWTPPEYQLDINLNTSEEVLKFWDRYNEAELVIKRKLSSKSTHIANKRIKFKYLWSEFKKGVQGLLEQYIV